VRDRAKRGAFTLTVTNAGVTKSCRVTMPARLGCLATQVSNVVPTPPGDGPSPGATACRSRERYGESRSTTRRARAHDPLTDGLRAVRGRARTRRRFAA